jgi:hypothetical protein
MGMANKHPYHVNFVQRKAIYVHCTIHSVQDVGELRTIRGMQPVTGCPDAGGENARFSALPHPLPRG